MASPPKFHVEHFPIGSCVCSSSGYNVLWFPKHPGAKFTTAERAAEICAIWNEQGFAPVAPPPAIPASQPMAGAFAGSPKVLECIQMLNGMRT